MCSDIVFFLNRDKCVFKICFSLKMILWFVHSLHYFRSKNVQSREASLGWPVQCRKAQTHFLSTLLIRSSFSPEVGSALGIPDVLASSCTPSFSSASSRHPCPSGSLSSHGTIAAGSHTPGGCLQNEFWVLLSME